MKNHHITDATIFALLKPRLKGIAVHFFLSYVGHISKWNSCTSYKWKSRL